MLSRHHFTFFAFCLITSLPVFSQQPPILIETSKTVGLLNFLETGSGQRNTSFTYEDFIQQSLGSEDRATAIFDRYNKLLLEAHFQRPGVPEDRYSFRTTKDLLWIAAANAASISDLQERTIGLFDHETQIELLSCLRDIEPYYDALVWDKEQKGIERIEEQLDPYRDDIQALFTKISQFYGTTWDESMPFKIVLYPIPLSQGMTTAIPKGNALICGFLSQNELDYEGRLGVAVHEMCHTLYSEQPVVFQQQLDRWALSYDSPFAKIAYGYLDEGLATALGNGWAFTQLHSRYDSTQWYNDPYIEGFARALYPLVTAYMEAGQTIDEAFVGQAIDIFGNTFPNANNKTKNLLSELQLFTNAEGQEATGEMTKALQKGFGTRSMWISSPIRHPSSIAEFGKEAVTKVFVITKEARATQRFLREHFPALPEDLMDKGWVVVKDEKTNSPVFVIVAEKEGEFDVAIELLKTAETVDFGVVVSWED